MKNYPYSPNRTEDYADRFCVIRDKDGSELCFKVRATSGRHGMNIVQKFIRENGLPRPWSISCAGWVDPSIIPGGDLSALPDYRTALGK